MKEMSVSEARPALRERATSNEVTLLTVWGKTVAAIVPIEWYRRMVEAEEENRGRKTVTVRQYLEGRHGLVCHIEPPDEKTGSLAVVDPFVTCAVLSPQDSFREVGRAMVGKRYIMEKYHFEDGVYLPDDFTEIPF